MSFSPGAIAATAIADPSTVPILLVATTPTDIEGFTAAQFMRVAAHTTRDVLRALTESRPRVIALDWDVKEIDGPAVCAAGRQSGSAILVMTRVPERVPSALKAGCHAVLLRPFVPNLLAARLGRLSRQLPVMAAAARVSTTPQVGTNRVWPDARCPSCDEPGAVSFEFSSYRRMWYACLACDHVWLGVRRE